MIEPASDEPPGSADLARLRRWEDAGGTWQVVARRPGTVTVALCRCDGGEEVDRFTSGDADVLELLGRPETAGEPGRDRAD